MSGEQQHTPDVNEALRALSARLDRIEAKLGMAAAAVPSVQPPVAMPVPPRVPAAPVAEVVPPALPLPVPVMAPPTAPPVTKLEEMARRKFVVQTAARGEAPPVASTGGHPRPVVMPPSLGSVGAPPTVRGAASAEPFKLERLVGGKLYAFAGALIVVVGLIMGLKLGMDKGWFRFPPELRCIGVAVFGVLLMGGGEFVRRRLGKAGEIAGAGLGGAGLAAVYGAVLAAFGMYHLLGPTAAFALLVIVSAGGIAMSLHAKSLPLAILSLVGAYLNPLALTVLGAKSESPLVMPSYLLALLVVGLVLAGWRPRPFRWLRGVAWWGTSIVGSLWIAMAGAEHPLITLPFLAIVWAMVHAELFIGSRRVAEGESVPLGPSRMTIRTVRPMLSSFATTIWSVGVGMLVAKYTKSGVQIEGWWISAAGLAGTSVMGMMFAGHLRAFRDMPETDGERLGVALWVQAGALLITTVALALGDWTQTIAWLAMGVGAIAAGRWAKAKGLEGYGLVVLVISLGRLWVWDVRRTGGTPADALGLVLDRGALLMLIGGAAWGAAAWLLNRPSGESGSPSTRRRSIVNVCTGIGLTLPFLGLLDDQARGVAMAGAGIVWGLVVLGVSRWRNSSILRYWGLVALMIVTAASLGVHMDFDGLKRASFAVGPLVLTEWTFVLLALGAAWFVGAWLVRAGESALAHAGAVVASALGVAVVTFSLLTKGTSEGAVCVVWAWIAIGLVAAHHRVRRYGLDVMGMAVLMFAALVWTYDYVIEQNWMSVAVAGLRHPGLWVAMAIVAAMIGAAAWLRRGSPMRATWAWSIPVVQAVAGVLLLASTSLEVARSAGVWFPASHTSQAASLTIWWAVFAVGMLMAGFMASVPIIRHLGLALLGVAAVKALIVDMASVAAEWRVASFIGVGLLMLGVAVGYAKVSSRLDRAARKDVEEHGGDGGAGGGV